MERFPASSLRLQERLGEGKYGEVSVERAQSCPQPLMVSAGPGSSAAAAVSRRCWFTAAPEPTLYVCQRQPVVVSSSCGGDISRVLPPPSPVPSRPSPVPSRPVPPPRHHQQPGGTASRLRLSVTNAILSQRRFGAL